MHLQLGYPGETAIDGSDSPVDEKMGRLHATGVRGSTDLDAAGVQGGLPSPMTGSVQEENLKPEVQVAAGHQQLHDLNTHCSTNLLRLICLQIVYLHAMTLLLLLLP